MPEPDHATASEAFLASLCERTFLRLWSYPNLFRDQGNNTGGEGKELCDLLVVFGDDLLLFSDKHCELDPQEGNQTSWQRWYRRAIIKSAKQVLGAEQWLKNHPERVFVDRQCSRPFPISLPENPRVHRILTCRGAAPASRDPLGGTGSLITTNQTHQESIAKPFHVGSFDGSGRFFHVLDEVALVAVLRTLDTVADFTEYLNKRAQFFQGDHRVLAAGEENLVGMYRLTEADDGLGHDFIPRDTESVECYMFDESHWIGWLESKQRRAKQEADRVSYNWDGLIEKFAHHMVNRTQHFTTDSDMRESERIVRWMAREPRVRRRMLAGALIKTMQTTGPRQHRESFYQPSNPGDPWWVFLVLPRQQIPHEEYREFRRNFLIAHCEVVKFLHPEAKDIVGIATEPPSDELSEDVAYLDARNWSDEDNRRARELHERHGLFKRGQHSSGRFYEFPIDDL